MGWIPLIGIPASLALTTLAFRLCDKTSHTRSYINRVLERRGRRLTFVGAVAAILLDRPLFALCMYRLSYRIGRPLIGRVLTNLMHFLTGVEIYYNAEIGRNVEIWHGQGTVIGQNARIADGCLILHQVTLGSGFVVLESDVKVGAGAKILGSITVGTGAVVGANAVVTRDVGAYTFVKSDGRTVPLDKEMPVSFGTRA